MAQIKYWVWLSSQTNAGSRARAALIEHYGDAETAFFAPEGEFKTIAGVTAADAAILEKRDLSRTDEILGLCRERGIRLLAMTDAEYPLRLRHTYAPPAVLYVKGTLPNVDDLPSVAVIGTRKASPYGLKMGRSLAYEIAKCGGVVVSGLTQGVDEAAAKGALLAGGACIGVLGTAIGESESGLYRDVAGTGALVSECPPGIRSTKSFFRERNRISAGLTAGVVIVEAPETSGALLFAQEAQEQGREIFAVPGNADSPNSAGTIELIKQGAKAVTCGWDVMEELQAMFPGKIQDAAASPCPDEPEAETQPREIKKTDVPQKVIDKKKDTGYIDLTKQLSQLSDEQLKIIAAIDRDGSGIDDIIEGSALGTAKVLSQLTVLEIKGYIRRISGRRIVLNTAKK